MKLVTRATFVATCLALLGILLGCDGNNTYNVKTEIVQVDSLDQIVLIEDSLVKPVLYTNVNSLEVLPFYKAKATFISAILPSILVAKHQVHTTKSKIIRLRKKKRWNKSDSLLYAEIKQQYHAKNIDDLIERLVTCPTASC
jgi:Bax protein